jgi:phage terminase Nu1 subunit (DNA packaging protein)
MSTRDNDADPDQGPGVVAPILIGWKNIARYLGVGIRTVQRWESSLGLPVRRTRRESKSTVLAVRAEIDTWVRARGFDIGKEASRKSERMLLLRSLRELQAENQELRRLLEAAERSLMHARDAFPKT